MYRTIEELKEDFEISIYENEITLIEFKDKRSEVIIPINSKEKIISKIKSLCFIDSKIKKIIILIFIKILIMYLLK